MRIAATVVVLPDCPDAHGRHESRLTWRASTIAAVSQTRYRIVLSLLGVTFAAIVIGAVILTPSGDAPRLPDAVDGYSPADGATVLRQTQLVIDLKPGYDIDLRVDGVPIPDSELDAVEETGRFVWIPGPGKTFEEWVPGFRAIQVTWDRTSGLPDPGELRWTFRVQ
jgi:hypothetical protein